MTDLGALEVIHHRGEVAQGVGGPVIQQDSRVIEAATAE